MSADFLEQYLVRDIKTFRELCFRDKSIVAFLNENVHAFVIHHPACRTVQSFLDYADLEFDLDPETFPQFVATIDGKDIASFLLGLEVRVLSKSYFSCTEFACCDLYERLKRIYPGIDAFLAHS